MKIKNHKINFKAALLSSFLLISSNSLADDFEWEFGVGLAGITIPHYLGSDEELQLALPLPYGTYEDKKTQIDRDGLNYNLFGVKDLDLSFSVSLGLPVDSEDNKARNGMPDLDTLVEVGPALKYWLFRDQTHELSIVLPVRSAFAFDDFAISQEGITGSIDLNYTHQIKDWEFNGTYSVNFGDKKYHSQFYDVANQFVTADRDYFQAQKGVSSHSVSFYINRRWNKFYFGLYARSENLESAVNRNSPLVRKERNLYASVYFGWVFASSKY